MKVHHCFIKLIPPYKFSILCQFPPLSHKHYDELHTLLKFPNLHRTTCEKTRGYLPESRLDASCHQDGYSFVFPFNLNYSSNDSRQHCLSFPSRKAEQG